MAAFYKRNTDLKDSEEAFGVKILCLGDSLTYGMGVLHKERWSSLVAKQTGYTVINWGISGDTTGGMLARFERDVLRQSPDLVIIMGGGNDIISTGTDLTARANLFALLQQTIAAGIQPVLATLLPIDGEHVSPLWAPLTDFRQAETVCRDYVQWVKLLGKTFQVPVADFYHLFASMPDFPGNWYLDGLHPCKEGHKRMAELMTPLLQKVVAGLKREKS